MPVHPPQRATRGSDRLIGTFKLGAIGAVVVAATSVSSSAILTSAPTPTLWQLEDVAAGNLIPGCVERLTLAGFDHDSQGRPVVAWREENGCGGSPRVFWTRKDSGAWDTHEFLSELRYAGGGTDGFFHQMILRPSDGNPFLVNRDVGPFNSLNTYRTDLGAHPAGGHSELLEGLVGSQQCATVHYSLAFTPGSTVPDWATGLATCNEFGPVRINGTDVASGFTIRPALAVTPDGVRHLLWSSGTNLFSARWPAGDPAPTANPAPIFANINPSGGEVSLASDALGVLHAAIRGVEGDDGGADLGAVVYITSTDGGFTWAPFEYVDPDNDTVPHSFGANSDISLALNSQGIPAVTYWRSKQELWYARRDGPNGTWTRSRVTVMPFTGEAYSARLDFDAADQAVIAYYDRVANQLRLARPLPPGVTPPVVTVPFDVLVEATGPAGATVNFVASAVDWRGAILTTTCMPPSGSQFAIGQTVVTCSATDSNGLTSSKTFNVKVSAPVNLIRVNTTAHHPATSADCTLREAIIAANTNAAFGGCAAGRGDDVIVLPAGTYEMTGAGYTDPNEWGDASLPAVTTSAGNQLEIIGAGLEQTLLVGKPGALARRFFIVFGDLTLRHLSVEGGQTATDGGVALLFPGPSSFGSLRAIASRFARNAALNGGVVAGSANFGRSRFEAIDSIFTGNKAAGPADGLGGVYSGSCNGSAVITSSTFDGNDARIGGAIYSGPCSSRVPSLEVTDSTFVDNRAGIGVAGSGGAIAVLGGESVITRTQFLRNRAGGRGGAIDSAHGTIIDSTFADNSAGSDGGAVHSGPAALTVRGSTFARNAAVLRGGALVLNGADLTVTNTTFSANTSVLDGGAIWFHANSPVRLNNVTVTGTVAPSAVHSAFADFADVTVANSIVAGNVGADWTRIHGTVTSLGHNLIGNGDGSGVIWDAAGDQAGSSAAPIDPRLGPLQDNGGPTETHKLLAGSPALDAGNGGAPGSGGTSCEATDQRGVLRPGSGTTRCDIGAVESTVNLPAGPIRVNTTAQHPANAADCTLSQAIEAANSHLPVGGCAAGGSPAVIRVPPGTYMLAAMNNTTSGRANGLPVVTTDLTIQSDGHATDTIIQRAAGAPAFGIFHIASSHQFALTGITVRGGDDFRGGAVFSDGGTLTLTNSAFVDNRGGGAINGATVNADASTFSGNHGGQGGALKITRGGLFVNVTISGNTADDAGGGIWFEGTDPLDLRSVTIVENEAIATIGGGVYVETGLVYLADSIVAGNASRDGDFDLSGISPGSFASRGFNLIGIHPGGALVNLPSDQVGTVAAPIDPRLGPLQHNGGTTATRLPRPGSTALDRGNAFALPTDPARCPALDQRGLGRPADGNGDGITICDIGAVEARPAEVVPDTVTTLTASPNPGTVGKDVTFTATVTSPIPSAGTPIGAVTFKDGATLLATVPLTDGRAEFVTSGLAVGGHEITAEYSGDTFFQPSQAAVLSLTIDLPPPAVISITEHIGASDSIGLVKSVMLAVTETISVQDAPTLLPSVMLTVAENIAVQDVTAPRPSVMLTVAEAIAVADSVALLLPPPAVSVTDLPVSVGAMSGNAVILSAVVSGAVGVAGVAPTGTVTFTYSVAGADPIVLGSVALANAAVEGSLAGFGTVTIVPGAAGAVTLTYSPNGGTGTVTVLGEVPDTAAVVGASVVGVATLATTLPAGVGKVDAVYSGDARFLTSNQSRTEVVNNTAPGAVVSVKPIDPATGGTPVAVTFANVTKPGFTSVTTSSVGPPSPAGFSLGEPPLYFDISTTAVFDGPIEVCIDYAGTVFKRTDGLRLFHFEGGAWVNRTVSAVGTSICAVVSSLSPFAIFEPINGAPTTAGDVFSTDEDVPATFNVLSNDHDPDGDSLAILSVTAGLHGSVAIVGSAIRYTPRADFNGTDGFDYTVSDGAGGAATAHVSITVRPVNDAPLLVNPGDQRSDEGEPVSLQLEASDVDADSLRFSATGLPPGLRISTTGLISGTPNDRTARVYWVTASISDGRLTTRQSFRWTVIDMSGRMAGGGEVAAGGLEHRFTFTVTERRNGADCGHVEFWISEPDTWRKPGKKLSRFDASTITAVTFSDDPDFKPGRRGLPAIDTVTFRGSGKWNGKAGYTFEAHATDEGEPGAGKDTFAITIRNAQRVVVATVSGTLAGGNIQSLRLSGR